jgi:hypothetical protein
VPPFAAPIIAERHCMLGCAQRSHLCTIELGRSYTENEPAAERAARAERGLGCRLRNRLIE